MIDFTVNEKNYKVVKPNAKQHSEANKIYTREFNRLLKEGVLMVHDEMMATAKSRGLWSDQKEQEIQEKTKEIHALQDKLDKGGYELDEAREDAKKIQTLRGEILTSQFVLNGILDNTVEQQAQSARYDYLASVCIVDSNNKIYCKSLDDYYNSDDDEVLNIGLVYFAKMYYGTANIEKSIDAKFIDDYGLEDKVDKKEPKKIKKVEKKPFLKNGKPVESS